ncbi:aminotransferase class I/II-fold pyridoxal phosphate-dependent enzyme [Halobacillus litoralis]|uniref:Aminotransferase n=1 Tax=Halobacillus litoralis TaxID=45668 RepID=A0A845DRR2_9BACI|nr:aminotransferase class I/II-fold pyridoxal phosphate-dependent enzyme [Halobacillus litoralis]MYL19549.1 aminotransferase class I/II-fold pyridoxal phosphate-dependent enzyme [Halobacillus litoralis]
MIPLSKQVQSLPAYLFSLFHKKKMALTAQGIDVIDLGIGAPDLSTPPFIIDKLIQEVRKPENHKYPPYQGCAEFKQAVSDVYQRRFQVPLDMDREILALIGSKEGIAHLIQSVLDPGDGVLSPDPGYPVYQSAVHLAYGVTIPYTLNPEENFAPAFDHISERDCARAKLMILNYPNNPTGGTVDLETYEKAVRFAKKNQLILLQDAAYDLVTFGDYHSPSLLQAEGGKDVGIEFGSLSKSFNMAGWRIGYAAGNEELIQGLALVKSNRDTGQFPAVQKAGAAALNSSFDSVLTNNRTYDMRFNIILPELEEMNIMAEKPRGTFFIWARVPEGYTSQSFAEKMLDEAGIILTPGTAFGQQGEGYIRISLTHPVERLHEAVLRMKKAMKGG